MHTPWASVRCVSRVACCVLRVACCVLRVACCVVVRLRCIPTLSLLVLISLLPSSHAPSAPFVYWYNHPVQIGKLEIRN
jgi:hypothetical protein